MLRRANDREVGEGYKRARRELREGRDAAQLLIAHRHRFPYKGRGIPQYPDDIEYGYQLQLGAIAYKQGRLYDPDVVAALGR
jgi:hypothetical protein